MIQAYLRRSTIATKSLQWSFLPKKLFNTSSTLTTTTTTPTTPTNNTTKIALKSKFLSSTLLPPPHYICHNCHASGDDRHYIKHCPDLNLQKETPTEFDKRRGKNPVSTTSSSPTSPSSRDEPPKTSKKKSRKRQHVNIGSSFYAGLKPSPESLDWKANLQDPTLPYHLDLGCGTGKYLSLLAKKNKKINWIGVEVNNWIAEEQKEQKENKLHAGNYSFIWANLLHPESLDFILSSLPKGEPTSVSILHPDPCFKKKHKKRDMVSQKLGEFFFV